MVGPRGVSPTETSSEIRAILRMKAFPRLGDRTVASLILESGSAVRALARARKLGFGEGGLEARPPVTIDDRRMSGVQIVPMTSPRYPPSLLNLTDPPPLVFLLGDRSLLERPAVAVVGSRMATDLGRRSAETIARNLAAAGVVVVSGMARGIDGAAHRGALSAKGGTVGVLGTGIGVVYPSSNRDLFQSIRRTGLLVSEFLPSEKGLPHHFPKRNRIIAALSRAVIVVEAGHRSGALITVEHALDLGREIFAVPGSVENKRALESNRLLRDGAQVLTEPRGAFETMKHLFPEVSPEQGELQLSGRESASNRVPEEFRTILGAVRQEPRSLSGVAEDAGVGTDQALAALSTLELEGWVIQLPGMRFRRP